MRRRSLCKGSILINGFSAVFIELLRSGPTSGQQEKDVTPHLRNSVLRCASVDNTLACSRQLDQAASWPIREVEMMIPAGSPGFGVAAGEAV